MKDDAVLLDTHVALWLDSGSDRLRASTRERIERCRRDGGTVYLSAVSAWEIALLADGKRIFLDLPAERWVERFIKQPGVAPAPLDVRAAARAYSLAPFAERDPADRLLIASAIERGCPLITYDRRIANFARRHGRRYGFSVAA